jgi:hypothetical protein
MAGATDQPLQGILFDKDKSEMLEHENVDSTGSQSGISWTPQEERKLVKKIDLMLLPTIWLMYLLSYMDRTKLASQLGICLFKIALLTCFFIALEMPGLREWLMT